MTHAGRSAPRHSALKCQLRLTDAHARRGSRRRTRRFSVMTCRLRATCGRPSQVRASRAHLRYLRPRAMLSAAEAAAASAPVTFASLPPPLVVRVFALLPVDARLRCAEVCRGGRALTLAERSLWTRLDLTRAGGVADPSAALLAAAAARAGGQLETLRVALHFRHAPVILALLHVVATNATSLRELVLLPHSVSFREQPETETLRALLDAAPGLRALECGLRCTLDVALPVLRREPPFGPAVRLKALHVSRIRDVHALSAALAVSTSLEEVEVGASWPETEAESNALVDALRSLPSLRSLALYGAPGSAVAGLLGCPTLETLFVENTPVRLLDSPASAAALCGALRANTHLETLCLSGSLWRDIDAAAALFSALQACPSLTTLLIASIEPLQRQPPAAGAVIAALVVHAPALASLNLSFYPHGDVFFGPVIEALPQAARLTELEMLSFTFGEDFARERLLPAVRACASLRSLRTCSTTTHVPSLREAQLLLAHRRAGEA